MLRVVRMVLQDGSRLESRQDSGVPAADLGRQEARLREKFERLVPRDAAARTELCELVLALERQPSLDGLVALAR